MPYFRYYCQSISNSPPVRFSPLTPPPAHPGGMPAGGFAQRHHRLAIKNSPTLEGWQIASLTPRPAPKTGAQTPRSFTGIPESPFSHHRIPFRFNKMHFACPMRLSYFRYFARVWRSAFTRSAWCERSSRTPGPPEGGTPNTRTGSPPVWTSAFTRSAWCERSSRTLGPPEGGTPNARAGSPPVWSSAFRRSGWRVRLLTIAQAV